jgi:hypothetical protein
MSMSARRLEAAIDSLRRRPGHENVRALVRELCVSGLGVPDREVNFEVPVPEVKGRIDAVFGATVFEFKRDLRRERNDAEVQLARYLAQRERATKRRYLGIATDGAEFVAYELSGGRLVRIDEHVPSAADPRGLLRWLDTAITVRSDLPPDPDTIRAEFGRDSLVYQRSMQELRELWQRAKSIPEAELKRELWHRHLEFVYGTLVEPDELFLQHTYLTIVAKTMAVRVLVSGPVPPAELLAGTPFVRAGLNGAVETDFFDWVLLEESGANLVDRIANQVGRFRLSEIEADVLKTVYESLIDPRQRHYLGEYYTPDWLADWICREAVPKPLQTRVLDPSCGSGTFIFHAVRRFLAAAEADGLSLELALERCVDHVVGIDVHPVAVLFARVTYLLAIGAERLRRRTDEIYIPVYLGDALQWDVRQLLSEEEIEIAVPGEPPLRFPGSVAGDPGLLELVLRMMRDLADQGAPKRAFRCWLEDSARLQDADREILVESYEHMRKLHQTGRNHIWTYIVRNLTRPLWLSLRDGKPDVVVGNPPWLRYNAMSPSLQRRFKKESTRCGLWVGGRVATQQDLSAYFFARVVERYLKRGGRIAFVMPLACLTRMQYKGFRKGIFVDPSGNVAAIVRFDEAWTFDSDVGPLFPVPSAVVFAHRDAVGARLPRSVRAFQGQLPRRDATLVEARRALRDREAPWPAPVSVDGGSPYRQRFKQGATIVPRRLMVVVPADPGRFGANANAPFVMSRTSAQDKPPWRDLKPLRGQVERRFLRPLLLGESIAPFRVLRPATAIIPWDARRQALLTSRDALDAGFPHLAAWLKTAERLWEEHGASGVSLARQLDYYGKLSAQFPTPALRVVYAGSGALPAAAVIRDDRFVIEHALYWAPVGSVSEARYLTAILNSEAARRRIEKMQAEGLFGPRHFDKVIFSLPFPRFSKEVPLHRALATACEDAERVAETVELDGSRSFQSARKAIREALRKAGVAKSIDDLVDQLLRGA